MKSQKIRDLDENELQHQLRTIEEQLFRLHFQMSKYLICKRTKCLPRFALDVVLEQISTFLF